MEGEGRRVEEEEGRRMAEERWKSIERVMILDGTGGNASTIVVILDGRSDISQKKGSQKGCFFDTSLKQVIKSIEFLKRG